MVCIALRRQLAWRYERCFPTILCTRLSACCAASLGARSSRPAPPGGIATATRSFRRQFAVLPCVGDGPGRGIPDGGGPGSDRLSTGLPALVCHADVSPVVHVSRLSALVPVRGLSPVVYLRHVLPRGRGGRSGFGESLADGPHSAGSLSAGSRATGDSSRPVGAARRRLARDVGAGTVGHRSAGSYRSARNRCARSERDRGGKVASAGDSGAGAGSLERRVWAGCGSGARRRTGPGLSARDLGSTVDLERRPLPQRNRHRIGMGAGSRTGSPVRASASCNADAVLNPSASRHSDSGIFPGGVRNSLLVSMRPTAKSCECQARAPQARISCTTRPSWPSSKVRFRWFCSKASRSGSRPNRCSSVAW